MELFEQDLIVYFTILHCEKQVKDEQDVVLLRNERKKLQDDLLEIFETKNHFKERPRTNF